MAISAVGHVPANALWLSRAAAAAARRTGKIIGESVLDHYRECLTKMAAEGFLAYWGREFQPYLRGAAERVQSVSKGLPGLTTKNTPQAASGKDSLRSLRSFAVK